jgi:hypothetical protein
MAEPTRVLLCAPSRHACAGGLRRIAACLPLLICPIFILILGTFLPHPGYRSLLAGMALLLALPVLPCAIRLLQLLWTRREVVLDLRERTVTESIRSPWRTVNRWCTFDHVRCVRVARDVSPENEPPWSLSLELIGGAEVPLSRAFRTDEALTLAARAADLLNVRVRGRIG